MSSTYKVRYQVRYDTTITVEDGQVLSDVLTDIEPPEITGTSYVDDSFETIVVRDEFDNVVDHEDEDDQDEDG